LLRAVTKITKALPSTGNDDGLQHLPSPDCRFTKVHLGSNTYELHLSFGIIRIRLLTYSFKDKIHPGRNVGSGRWPKHSQVIATFLPGFTQLPMLEWTISRMFNSLKVGLQICNVIPAWSPIFEFTKSGDLVNVRKLMDEGLASPNDVDEEGLTVLHVS